MLKPSKFMAQLQCSRWSDTADCLTFLRLFCKTGDPHAFSRSGIKVAEGFSLISNLAVTTLIRILFRSQFFFSSESLDPNSVLSLHLDLKITLSLKYGKSLSIVRLSLVLKSSESVPLRKLIPF